MSETHGIVEDVHEYELLDKYCQAYEEVNVPKSLPLVKREQQQASSTVDYDYTKCPAYVPIPRGPASSQQAKTSFKQPSTTGMIKGKDLDEITSSDDEAGY